MLHRAYKSEAETPQVRVHVSMVMKFQYYKLAGNSNYGQAGLQMKTKAQKPCFLPGVFEFSQLHMVPYFLLYNCNIRTCFNNKCCKIYCGT
jgi:hypothetical protein